MDLTNALNQLRRDGYNFLTANSVRKIYNPSRGDTVVYLLTTNRYLLSPENNGGHAKDHFTLLDTHGVPRHAVICKVEKKGDKLHFSPSPYPFTISITEQMCHSLDGIMDCPIEATLHCWENTGSQHELVTGD